MKEQLDSWPGSSEAPDSLGCARRVLGVYQPLLSSRPRSFQLDRRFEAGRVQGKRGTVTGEGEKWGGLVGLGWAEGVVAGGAARAWRAKEGRAAPGAWSLGSGRAGPPQLLSPAPLPCRLSSSWSRPLCPPLPDPGMRDEHV